ncbi:MAG: TIGR03617 family F420-dependent LLM class oxidoreductase [Acidimicrobiia bacterium]|nr:TIGR03617 family F420-dependent LLM class oxidoreductase [Acidimicrobiia bacterium]MYC46132.1 TIGR03617 family F420-dependent LLM class oxidoreductase [Acidimicrobiia bacterium]MYI19350.1 TIGR03617 family F420-dependent LLM class oxidoreductase [Acidimicrobiia bacterium]
MRIDAQIGSDPTRAAQRAELLEATDYDGVWISERIHDPFLGLALAAARTRRLTLGTSIAVAFARNPMTTAQLGWDLQSISGGRFNLGLASLIKPHITRRFSMPWSEPAARMREYVAAMHAIWDAWESGGRLDFRGDYYQHTFTNPMFIPPPSPYSRPAVHLGAVGPLMTQTAGRAADGLLCHPLTTASYLNEVMLANLRAGLDSAERPTGAVQITVFPLLIAAETAESFDVQARETRRRIANGASTPAYRAILEHHGWSDAHEELLLLTKQGRWTDMPDVIDDEMLRTIAAVGTPAEVARILEARYGDVASRLIITTSFNRDADGHEALAADRESLLHSLRDALGRNEH